MANPRKLSFNQLVNANHNLKMELKYLEIDREDERRDNLKLEEELEELKALQAGRQSFEVLTVEMAELSNALVIMRELYLASFEALEAQKKLNKALIGGLLG